MCNDTPNLLRIYRRPSLGRYAQAARNISAGEIFIDEIPFVIGPKPSVPPICLGCYIPINGGKEGPKCPRCHWPLCEKCAESLDDSHHAAECRVFVANKVQFQSFPFVDAACMQLDCITPLRMLLKRDDDPIQWENEIMQMEYHPLERVNTSTYRADEVNIVGYLRGPCKLKDRFSAELIQKVCGILEVNSFEARTVNDNRVRCIYPNAAVLAHSCRPNTMHTILPSDQFRLQFRATIDINESDVIYLNYSYILSSTQIRHRHLQLSKYFVCKCERCTDPTELGTHFSSFVCQQCPEGLITPVEPFVATTEWHCSDCSFKTTNKCIEKGLSLIESEIQAVDENRGISNAIHSYETLLVKYGQILHPNHYLLVRIKEILMGLYALSLNSYRGFQIQLIDCLQRRLDISQSILSILNVLQPGLNRARAMMLYEIYTSEIAFIKLNWNSLSNRDGKIAETNAILDECLQVLKWEDETSVERSLVDICDRMAESMLMMSLDEIPMY